MNSIVVSLNGQRKEEIEKTDGEIISISLQALLPTISDLVKLRRYEVIDGLVISDTEVRVKISRKRGRETKTETLVKELVSNGGLTVTE